MADFLCVYVKEAHTTDGWRLGSVVSVVPAHKTLADRRAVAQRFVREFNFPLPTVVDTMADAFDKQYAVWPERMVVVDADGKLAYVQRNGPGGVAGLWTTEAAAWLRSAFPHIPFPAADDEPSAADDDGRERR